MLTDAKLKTHLCRVIMSQKHVYMLAKLKTVAIVHPGHVKVKTHGVKLQHPWFDSKVVIFSDLCQILVSCPNLYYDTSNTGKMAMKEQP